MVRQIAVHIKAKAEFLGGSGLVCDFSVQLFCTLNPKLDSFMTIFFGYFVNPFFIAHRDLG
jgi:hypothetical protein